MNVTDTKDEYLRKQEKNRYVNKIRQKERACNFETEIGRK